MSQNALHHPSLWRSNSGAVGSSSSGAAERGAMPRRRLEPVGAELLKHFLPSDPTGAAGRLWLRAVSSTFTLLFPETHRTVNETN